MLTMILLRVQSPYVLAARHKLIFLLLPLTLASALLWLGQPGAQPASAKSALLFATPTPTPPNVHLVNVPNQALIDEDFTFFVTFDNSTAGSTVGFAPFIDLVLDSGGADHNNSSGPCDGIQLIKAEMVDVNGSPINLIPLVNVAPCNTTPAQLSHPFGGSPFGPVTVPAGGELRTILLPFGSFQPNQPQVKIKVTAHISGFADLNYALHIYASGGFRYGQDPLNNASDPPILTETNLNAMSWVENQSVTPVVFDIHKFSKAPEDETATGPNFPHKTTITLNVADQQHVDHFLITDHLPGNLQFNGNVHVTIQGNAANPVSVCPTINPGPFDVVITAPSLSSPDGTLTVQLCSPIIGTLAPDDVVVTFDFYIPEKDANGQDILAPDCSNSPVKSINDVEAMGNWSPLDPRDTPVVGMISNVTPNDYLLNAKCLALQKSASIIIDTGSPGLTPGDTLQYQLRVQFSDFKTIGGLVVQDFLSNGQTFVPGSAVVTISDMFGTKSGPIFPAFINQTTDLNGASHFCPPPLQTPPSGTVITFNIKGAMQTIPTFAAPRLNQGIVTGGFAAGATGPHPPATGVITFRAHVNDTFQLPVPGDKFVDKDDPINDCVVIMGDVFQNRPHPKPINLPINIPTVKLGTTHDESATHLLIKPDTLLKKVYAVKRGVNFICGPPASIGNPPCSNAPNAPQQVLPGDQVTFSLEKTISSSDAEHLTIEDLLPAPAFNSSGMTFSNTQCGIPSANTACLGPSDQIHALVGPSWPTFVQIAGTNSIKFDYVNNIHDSNNIPRTIQLLFTSLVTNQPFADGLFFMNEAQECETDSFGDPFCQKAIAQIDVREPSLKITKGVEATSNPHGIFSPALNPANVWQPFGASCPRFQNGPITSATIGGLTNSDLSNVDASDFVTFAIGVENQGGAPACDIQLADIIPLDPRDAPSCFGADFSSLCITDGAGNPIPFTTAPGGHGRMIIKFAPGYCLAPGSPTNTTGSNIAIVTFNGQLMDKDHLEAGCCKNKAEVVHYSSVPGGPDFVGAGFTGPFSDDATICSTTLEKSIVATSEVHTAPQTAPPGTPQAAIGEVFRYRLLVNLPESNDPNFEVADNLPAGMMFLNDGSARVAFISNNGTGITHSAPGLTTAFNVAGTLPLSSSSLMNAVFTVPAGIVSGGTGCGSAVSAVTFNLGNVQNNHNDPDIEYVEIEFNALVCNIAGNQQPVNQSGTQLSDTFNVSVNGNVIGTSNPVVAQIVEPHLDLQKTVTPPNPIGTRTFTVSLTNTGQADAFDVHLTDPVPAGFTLVTPAPSVSVSPVACAVPTLTVSGNTLMIDVPRIPAAPTCTVKLNFTVRVDHCDTNIVQVTYTSLPGNAPVGTQANTLGNNTGSSTPCSLSTNVDCERVYTASAQASVNTGCTTCAPQPPHMWSWWRLDETSGNIVHDSTSNNHDGTTSSNIGVAPVSAFVPMVNNALDFVFNSMAVVPGSPYNFGTGSFSIDAWVQGPVSNANLGIVDKLDTTSSTPTGFAFFVTGGKLTLKLGSSVFQSPANSFTYNTWQHVAVTVQGGTTFVITFYINGVQSGPTFTPAAVSVNNTQDLLIGFSRLNPGCPSCEVTLDEIEIFDNVLLPADILAIFKAGHIGKCP